MINFFIERLASVEYKKILTVERRLGYKLVLHQNPKYWIDGAMPFDMTPVWKRFSLDAVGINYMTIGRVENGISSRFDPASPYFQSWLGGYIVKFGSQQDWTIQDHFKLGVADQKNWLHLYGVRSPVVEIDYKGVKNLGSVKIGRYKGTLYKGVIRSNIDVGEKINMIYQSLIWLGGVYFYKQNNPKLKLQNKHFIPAWSKKYSLSSYQVVDLEGYILIVEVNRFIKAVCYANGVCFTDKNGKKADTFKIIHNELYDQISKFEIVHV